MWAAEKLGKTGQDAEKYSNALAVGTLDPECSDVLIRVAETSFWSSPSTHALVARIPPDVAHPKVRKAGRAWIVLWIDARARTESRVSARR